MMIIGEGDVLRVFVGFVDREGGKKRPVIVVQSSGDSISIYKITTKYENKSDYIKEQYYKLKKWKEAGLSRQSWVDIGDMVTLNISDYSTEKLGVLTEIDANGIEEQIIKVAKKRTIATFRKKIRLLVQKQLEVYLVDSQIPKELVQTEKVVQSIAETQTNYGIPEIIRTIMESKSLGNKPINEAVDEFIRENYDEDFFIVKFEQKIDKDSIKMSMIESLVSQLNVAPRYKAVERTYWSSKLEKVQNIKISENYIGMLKQKIGKV